MNPLLSLASLSTDIEHMNAQLSHVKPRLTDTSGLRPRSQNISLIGHIIWPCDFSDVGEKVSSRVHKIEF